MTPPRPANRIDTTLAVGATGEPVEFEWSPSDVMLYQLALGCGHAPTDPRELRYVTENDLVVLPTFALVAPSLRSTLPPRLDYPGLHINLADVLHAGTRLTVHGALPSAGQGRAVSGIAAIHDKGSAAVIVTSTTAVDSTARPLWSVESDVYVRGAGGFGGDRGPGRPAGPPDRLPDHRFAVPTLPQQALLYRLLGDRNPLHCAPSVALTAGFDRPILHGLCTLGMAVRGIADACLGGAAGHIRSVSVRYSGHVFPGEVLTMSVWSIGGGTFAFRTTVDDRDEAAVLAGELTAEVSR